MSEPVVFESDSAARTRAIAEAFGRLARAGDVLLLSGPLGAGKTQFVQGLAQGLGVRHVVRSPTFVLLARYPGRVPLAHLDLYRLESRAAIEELGLEDEGEGSVLAVEWGEKASGLWPEAWTVRIEETGESARRLHAVAPASEAVRLRAWREGLA